MLTFDVLYHIIVATAKSGQDAVHQKRRNIYDSVQRRGIPRGLCQGACNSTGSGENCGDGRKTRL